MTKQISHYVARFDIPGYPKGYHVSDNLGMKFPDVFEPVYKEDPVVPPGILSFIDKNGSPSSIYKDIEKTNPEFYKRWILRHQDDSVLTISVRGTEWTCGEKTNRGEIEKFYWDYDQGLWKVAIKNPVNDFYYWLHDLRKLPTRTPICQLPDENGKIVDMYEGDTSYWVFLENFKIGKDIIQNRWGTSDAFKHFATRAAAEKYVFDNQPFYPRGFVEAVIQARNSMDYSQLRVSKAIDNLEAFKETHLK